jgi:hypothetical protein
MGAIVKGFVVLTLGLAVLFAWSAVSLAQPKIQRVTECKCTCWYTDAEGNGSYVGVLTFSPQKPNDTSCTHRQDDIPCKDEAGVVHPGKKFAYCKFIPGIIAPVGPAQRAP